MTAPRRCAVFVALVLLAGCSGRPSQNDLRSWDAELHRLRAEQDSLRARAAALLEEDPGIKRLPKGDIVILVPTAFVRSVVERVSADVVSNITLRLTGIKARVAKSVKKVVKIGEFVLDVDITEVVGRLRPGKPRISFEGNRISMSLPVEIREGHGEATVHFVWDGKNVADLTCGDLDITQKVKGDVIPASYVLTGALDLSIQGRHVVGKLDFPETKLLLRVEPSKESWDAVHAILEEKRGVCGWVLDKVDVPKILDGVIDKGFNVTLPLQKIRPFVVPAGVRDSVKVADRTLFVDARTNLLRIDHDAIWYAADVTILPAGREAPLFGSAPQPVGSARR